MTQFIKVSEIRLSFYNLKLLL